MTKPDLAGAVASLYESELRAIGEMLSVVGVPDSTEPDRHRVRWLIDRYLEQHAALTRMVEFVEEFWEEDELDDLKALDEARQALGRHKAN